MSTNADALELVKNQLREKIVTSNFNAKYKEYLVPRDGLLNRYGDKDKYDFLVTNAVKINLNGSKQDGICLRIRGPLKFRGYLGLIIKPLEEDEEVKPEWLPEGYKAILPANTTNPDAETYVIQVYPRMTFELLSGEGAGENQDKLVDAVRWFLDFLSDKNVLQETPKWSAVENKEQNMNQEESNLSSASSAPEIDQPRNWLLFGAPGTGKSFKLNQKACRHKENGVDKDGAFDDENRTRYERVTFYPTYSYAQFVGTYKPVMKPIAEDPSKEEISYEFVPGPFLRVLVNALNEPPKNPKNWCLIIEEINRANAAAVFGDVFQLLDRNSEGESEYSIAVSEDVKRFLSHDQKEGGLSAEGKEALKNLTGTEDMSRIRIPCNMYLWATMNSADQGVFPMDTAFKRRWEFEYMAIDEGGDDYCEGWKVKNDSGEEYKWNALRKFLNRLLELNGVNEDKLMGPFFVKAKDNQIDLKQFTSKVLMYLWEDAARMCRAKIFGDDIRSYSKLVDKWKEQGLEIFEAAKQMANDKDLNSLFPSALPKSGDSNGGSISSDSVGAGENGSQG